MKQVKKKTNGSAKKANAKLKEEKAKKRVKFVFPESPKPLSTFFRSHISTRSSSIEDLCELGKKEANRLLRENCAAKQFAVDSIYQPCENIRGSTAKPVDLVVIIDTSFSMNDEASSLSTAADNAIEAARKQCSSDLRVVWFGLEGVFENTKFDTKLRDYLHSLNIQDSDIDHRIGTKGQEDGGWAIKDVCFHFDWRPNTSRAILFLGDEPLAGGVPQESGTSDPMDDDKLAADAAIHTAQKQNVTVFTYAGTGIENWFDSDSGVSAEDEYSRVATSTGGLAYSAVAGNINEFEQILVEIICTASGGLCGPVILPRIQPCFRLKWGDGINDHIETDDVEVLCLTATNPHTNVTIRDLTLFLVIINPDGKVATLPDGSPSVVIKPYSFIHFGDIAPCTGDRTGEPPGVSREVVLISRGAKEGIYYVIAAYCYSVQFKLATGSIFPIELVRS